uniref:BTB domain-containing protein n=1 Tax=Strongyloides papillosus TaxID=174720 RepID=A0A0N5CH35_STREA
MTRKRRKTFLLVESNGLLINDKLTILCEVEIIDLKFENHYNPETSINPTIPQSKLLLDYDDVFDSLLFTDCIIGVKDTEIKLHKAVLAARSSAFYNTFNSTLEKSKTNIIEIKDFSVEVVREMLKYIYKDEVSNIQNMANGMFKIANKYELHRLKAISEQSMCRSLTIENVCERFTPSETYSIETWKECCQDPILVNGAWLTKTKE